MYRVLIVDDEYPFLQSLRLFDWGANDCICVGQASNGKEALEKCLELVPHIVITDINMPVVDGITFLSRVHEKYPEIQVILLTVYQNFDYARSAIQYGACAYIVKDMDYASQLTDALERARRAYSGNLKGLSQRADMLHRSGHILVLEDEKPEETQREELSDFLQRSYHALVTIYCPGRYQSVTQLISEIDSLPAIINESAGIIIRNKVCCELLFDIVEKDIGSAVKKLFVGCLKDIATAATTVAYKSCRSGLTGYLTAHQENMNAIASAFYEDMQAFRILMGQSGELKTLPLPELNTWTEEMELTYRKDGDIKRLLAKISADCREHRYDLGDVKSAFSQMLSRCELNYAARADEQAHNMLMGASGIGQLARIIGDAVQRLKNEQTGYSYLVNQAVEYISNNLGVRGLQLADVSEHAGISPGYLSKKLKEETGSTFQELLIRLRMEKAYKLLKNSSKKVYEVAETVGYENYRSFANTFSNYYHKNPKDIK